MDDTFEIGQIVWVCVPSDESLNYDDHAPRQPYQVKITRKLNEMYQVNCFDKETGEIDDDTNATAHVYPQDMFLTKEVAQYHCRDLCKRHAYRLLKTSLNYITDNEVVTIIQKAMNIIGGNHGS